MKFVLLLSLSVFISVTVNAQSSYLELSNRLYNTVVMRTIQEGKRVEVNIKNEKTLFGKLRIVNDSMLAVRDHVVNINSINYIKRNPPGLNIFSKVLFIGGGAILLISGSWSIWFLSGFHVFEPGIILAALATGSGAVSIIIGLLNRNVFTKKLHKNEWNYRVVQLD